MPQSSHKHHFVPAFYTGHWTGTDGRLVAWSKPHKSIIERRKHPEGVGWEGNLYSFDDLPSGTREWFEDHFLRHVDTQAANALEKMTRNRTTALSAKERSAWTRFVFTLRYRHPDVLKEIRENIAAVWKMQLDRGIDNYEEREESFEHPTYEDYVASLTAATHAHFHSRILRGLMDNELIGNRINNMYWQVCEFSGAGLELLTSDWPVETRFAAQPRYIAIPISPRALFVAAEDAETLRRFQTADAIQLIKQFNTSVVERARRFVFSSDMKQERFIRNRMSRNMEATPFYPCSVYKV